MRTAASFLIRSLSLILIIASFCATHAKKHRLIIWSIDGFAAGYLTNAKFQESAVWSRLLKRGKLYAPVETTIPAVTYPAHTAMVTGVDTAKHGIYSNHPVDPFNLSKDGWSWFTEDISAKPIWDIARAQKKSVANILWPVTMMRAGRLNYHFPQFDRARGPEEMKLMRVISTPGLYREVEKQTGVALTEYSSDAERIRVGAYIWKKKNPDLMLLYNPGLDSIEHASGPYSDAALRHLDFLGFEIEKFLSALSKNRRHESTAVLIVSDHGFMTYRGKCHPNAILKSMGDVDPQQGRWSYFFDTAGGVARLVSNGVQPPFAAKEFAEKLGSACPDIEYVGEGHADFQKLRHQYDAKAPAFLISRANVLLSAPWNKEPFLPDATGHTHGFLPDRPDMHTLALLFNPERKNTVAIRKGKDSFPFACAWLHLRCPRQKKPVARRRKMRLSVRD